MKPDKRCIRIPRYLSLHNITITNVHVWLAKYICVQLVCKHSFLSLHILSWLEGIFSVHNTSSLFNLTKQKMFKLNCQTLRQKEIWMTANLQDALNLNNYLKQQQLKPRERCVIKYLNVNLFIIAILKCTRHIFLSYYKLPKYLPKFNYILTLHQCANLKKKKPTRATK